MITLGADPEVFVTKSGVLKSAHGLVPGTKNKPFLVEKGAVQVDGIALEFNIDPATSYKDFQNNLDHVFSQLKSMVPDYEVSEASAVILSKDLMADIPEEALQIGCSPDVNAYSEDLNEGPPSDTLIRAAGGHIHIGGFFSNKNSEQTCWNEALRMARLMDKYVGVYSILWDEDDLRRTVYGKAAACRPKSYGVEYRTLSNSWLFKRPITEFVWNSTKEAVEAFLRGEDVKSRLYQGIINGSKRYHPFFEGDKKAEYVKSVA